MTHVTTWVIGFITWVGLTVVLSRHRRWLLFYMTGAFGFVLMVASGAIIFNLDVWMEHIEAVQVQAMAHALGIAVTNVEPVGLAIATDGGWAVFDIGIECSAILEMVAIVGLIAFYPGVSMRQKMVLGVIGMMGTYIVNILRILLIVGIISTAGTDWVFAAHAVIGRMFFFAATIALYWFLLTRPTIATTKALVSRAGDQ